MQKRAATTTRDTYHRRLRRKQVQRLVRVEGLSLEYARAVVALVYKQAG